MKGNILPAMLMALTVSSSAMASVVEVVDTPLGSGNVETLDGGVEAVLKKDPYDSLSYEMPTSALQLKKDVDYSYLELNITKSDRLKVRDDGTIVFIVMPDTLEQNARDLLAHTKDASLYTAKNFPEALRLYNSFTLEGDDVLVILDQMIAPFYDTENVIGDYYPNNIVELKVGN